MREVVRRGIDCDRPSEKENGGWMLRKIGEPSIVVEYCRRYGV